jgi:putative tricarboxylic transport membrane protein
MIFDVEAILAAINLLTNSWEPWIVVPPGLIIGLVFGAIPGLSISMGMAVFLPMTLYMDFVPAMLFLTSIFTGGTFGSAVPAILMNIPGSATAVATAFDGYPMAKQGKHNEALGLALAASTVGTAVGYMILFVLIQPIADLVLRIGPPEMFLIVIWGLTMIAAVRGHHFGRGILAGALGTLIGTIGFSQIGVVRGTMGIDEMLDGIPVVPAMIGLFAASELFNLMQQKYLVDDPEARRLNFRGILRGFRQAFSYPTVLFRGSLIGTLIGAIPGVGGSIANLISYAETKRRAKKGETFGDGNPKGVVASESANSSSEGGSMVTLLALGLPGGSGTAVMLAAFAMHNINGGPRFIRENTDIVYAIVFSNFAQTIALMLIGLMFVHLLASIVRVPLRVLIPSVLALSVMGSYGLVQNMSGPYTVLVFAVLGWVMRRYNYSAAAMVIGLLLGPMAEAELLRSYQLGGSDLTYVLFRPGVLIIIFALALAAVAPRLYRWWTGRSTVQTPS